MELEALSVPLELPDLWQQEAVRHLKAGHDVVLGAPTGAGKTFVFELLVRSGALRGQAIYTVPTRALANDKWREWDKAGWDVGITTGDRSLKPDASVVVATLETQREHFLEGRGPALLVIDEYQMIADARRGLNYELAIALSPPETQLLLMSGSVANPGDIAGWLGDLGREARLVETHDRPVPLEDIPVAALPARPPASVKGFWARVASTALLADCAPLLIFAPQRKAAEKIARQISDTLPQSQPLTLTQAQQQALGNPLNRMVANRVAYHHSGLSYAQRAGIIEPLAKAGQLRVVVATTGLAAGINFSVRSVFIGETHYFEGPFRREIEPDELLQMFGRAGRRGLDEVGYVLSEERSPRLFDAHPRQVRRNNQVDWPTLLRIMHRACEAGESPFAAAEELCRRLYSRQAISLGFEAGPARSPAPSPPSGGDAAPFDLGPTRREWQDSTDSWEPAESFTAGQVPLRDVSVRTSKRGWVPALKAGAFLQEHVRGLGRLCRLGREKSAPYGAEITLGQALEGDTVRLARRWQKTFRLRRDEAVLAPGQIADRLREHLESSLAGVTLHGLEARKGQLFARLDLSGQLVAAHRDAHGTWILRSEPRVARLELPTAYVDEQTGLPREPAPGSAASAWRRLKLIEPDGSPTLRGRIFSFFDHGEGLAVAAALEDETYPTDELVFHLANLRAGYRFAEDQTEGWPSERLGWTCRQTYGPVDEPGYLRLGHPEGYGDGGAEVVEARLTGRSRGRGGGRLSYGNGDVERALVEWLSLLRHLLGAPELDWARWQDLREAARIVLGRHGGGPDPYSRIPELAPQLLHRPIRHRFTLKSPPKS